MADPLLKQYVTLAPQNQEVLINVSSSSKHIETYSILYALIQSIYRDLLEDPVFNQFNELNENKLELVKEEEQVK